MPRVKDTSTKKRGVKTAPVLGAAGLSFAMVGGASAAAVPTADVAMSPTLGTDHQLSLGVEEIADVSLATFYVFDKESTASAKGGTQVTWVRGCGGCRGCRRTNWARETGASAHAVYFSGELLRHGVHGERFPGPAASP